MGFTHIGKIIKHKGLKGHLILRITKGYKIKEINTIQSGWHYSASLG